MPMGFVRPLRGALALCVLKLRGDDLAAEAFFVRSAWGHQARSVATIGAYRARERRSP